MGRPRARPLLLISLFLVVGVCAMACFVVFLVLISERGTLGTIFQHRPSRADQHHCPHHRNGESECQWHADAPAPTQLTIGSNTYSIEPVVLNAQKSWQYDATKKRLAIGLPERW